MPQITPRRQRICLGHFDGHGFCHECAGAKSRNHLTYQGELASGGVLVSNSCAFQFELYDAATAGTQIGGTLAKPGVAVTNGVFSVLLDLARVPLQVRHAGSRLPCSAAAMRR